MTTVRLMLLSTVLVAAAAAANPLAATAGQPGDAEALGEKRTFNNYALTGTTSSSSTGSTLSNGLAATALLIVPLLVLIVILDFAIFGAFANRSDELNPVSEFFWHVKRGMDVMRERNYRERYPPRRRRRKRRRNNNDGHDDDLHRNGDGDGGVYSRNDYDDFYDDPLEEDAPQDIWEELGLRSPSPAAAAADLESPRVAR